MMEAKMEIINAVKAIVTEAETMRNAYFFRSPGSAGARRSYEKYHSHDRVEWVEAGHVYTAEFRVSCSCANVYAYGVYTRDGSKTTLTAIKNSLKRMEAEAAKVEAGA